MRKLVLITVVLASLVGSFMVSAGEGAGGTVYDKDGNRTGYVKQSRIVPGQFELYDKDWNRTGYVRQNRLQPDRFDLFDQDWNRKGHLEKTGDGWRQEENETNRK